MSIWNRVQQVSESSFAFRPFEVDPAFEQPAKPERRVNESLDDFEELLPTGD